MDIVSPANSQLKLARRVRDLREEGLIFLEGPRLIEECLTSNLKLHSAFHLTDEQSADPDIILELKARNCPVYETSRSAFASLTDTVSSQGIIVIASRPVGSLDEVFFSRTNAPPLVVAMDHVQDPGNAGTIIRTAEAAGASGVVAMSGTTNPFAPKALRASMGSAFRLPVTSGVQVTKLIELARANGACLVAADAKANVIYTDHDWKKATVLFVGNEGSGIDPAVTRHCDASVRIPITQTVESLNVATATAVILFEAARQRASR